MGDAAFMVRELDASLPDVRALVFSSWIKPLRAANDRSWEAWRADRVGDPPVSTGVFCSGLHNRIEALLGRPGVRVFGATPDGSSDVILGFAVVEGGATLHWVSVKEAFRRSGIARALLRESRIDLSALHVTSRTEAWKSFARHCGIRALYDPFAL